jgi:leucyl/phenylalanyl-tRNA--protein transferase
MISFIEPNAPVSSFPEINKARRYPDGLLAVGGDLSIERLIYAYKSGIFPWYNEGDPILWWSPNPRCVLFPKKFHISKSFKKTLKKHTYIIKQNTRFEQVINQCANNKRKQEGTWINEDMIQAYTELHFSGHAHSIEVWDNTKLVGGLYGIQIGHVFFGESMFSLVSDASKLAFHYLAQQTNIKLIDCQIKSDHMIRMGAQEIKRNTFEAYLHKLC